MDWTNHVDCQTWGSCTTKATERMFALTFLVSQCIVGCLLLLRTSHFEIRTRGVRTTNDRTIYCSTEQQNYYTTSPTSFLFGRTILPHHSSGRCSNCCLCLLVCAYLEKNWTDPSAPPLPFGLVALFLFSFQVNQEGVCVCIVKTKKKEH